MNALRSPQSSQNPQRSFVDLRVPRILRLTFLILAGLGAAASAQQQRTVWDGVYTAEQAARGQQLFKDKCGYCHRDDLAGGGSEAGAPALKGPIFTIRWRDEPLADLFATIGTTMPQNKPDSMMPQDVIDIVSFLLKANEMPAGEAELPPNLEELKTILMTERQQ